MAMQRRTERLILAVVLSLLSFAVPAFAATCPDGSGTWTVSVNTTQSTDVDCIVINVTAGATLNFSSNITVNATLFVIENGTVTHVALGTVNITTTNLTIETMGNINVSRRGYPGGASASNGNGPGGGYYVAVNRGTGAGHGGIGGEDNAATPGGVAYDNATHPSQPGSSGAGASGNIGGAGGGLILLNVTDTATINGRIEANGQGFGVGGGGLGGGAGGTILLFVSTLTGSGAMTVNGGVGQDNSGATSDGGSGAGGRIAIHVNTNTFSGSLDASGGAASPTGGAGGPGTIYLNNLATGEDTLTIDNRLIGATAVTNISREYVKESFTHLNITNATLKGDVLSIVKTTILNPGTIYLNTPLVGTSNVTVRNGSYLTHTSIGTSGSFLVNITAQHLILETGGQMNVSTKGYSGGGALADGYGPGAGVYGASSDGSGGGHGGTGGADTAGSQGGIDYDNITNPTMHGSGGAGGSGASGGAGGGVILINMTGTLTVNGSIDASGEWFTTGAGGVGGGAGGTIYVNAQTLSGAGTIVANGGKGRDQNSNTNDGGSGAGGRIALHFETNTLSGILQTFGGPVSPNGAAGGAGTIYLNDRTSGFDTLVISNAGISTTAMTNLSLSYTKPSFAIVNLTNTTITGEILGASSNLYFKGTAVNVTVNISGASTITSEQGVSATLWGSVNASIVNVSMGSNLSANANILATNITVESAAILSHTAATMNDNRTLNITTQNLLVAAGGTINVSARGYPGGGAGSAGTGPGTTAGSSTVGTGGASHGGAGGNGNNGGSNGATVSYGDLTRPSTHGSGAGGSDVAASAGGGVAILNITNTLFLYGTIDADGGPGAGATDSSGGSAGGSVWIITNMMTGTGTITASGGRGGDGTDDGGGGGGGRVSISHQLWNFTGVLRASGAAAVGTAGPGSDGTIFRCEYGSGRTCPGFISGIALETLYLRNETVNITRNLTSDWNDSRIIWNESANQPNTIGQYVLTGLTYPNYKVFHNNTFNNSVANTGSTDPFQANISGMMEIYVSSLGNTPPIGFNVTINGTLHDPTILFANEDLHCFVNASDVDDFNVTAYWTWFNGTEFYNASSLSIVANHSFYLLSNLSASVINTNEAWTCQVIIGDAYENLTARNVTRTTDANVIPLLDDPTITPSPAFTNDELLGWCNATDEDNDPITYHWFLYRNGTYVSNGTNNNSDAGFTAGVLANVVNVSIGETFRDENWILSCLAYDGSVNSSFWRNSSALLVNNSLPLISPLILNSTFGTNESWENLTAYATITDSDGDAIFRTFDWRLNGSSIALLHMDFDLNDSAGANATRDLSTNSQNGTLGTTTARPTWNDTTGYNGSGVYYFDGGDYINIANSAIFDVQRLSISAWVYSDNFARNMFIFEKGSVNTQYSFFFEASGSVLTFRTYNSGATIDDLDITPGLAANQWHHVVATYNGTHKAIFVDGTLAGSKAYTQTLRTGQSGERIGAYGGGSPSYFFIGRIDDLTVYNRSLSPEQIYELYNNRTNVILGQEILPSNNWTVCTFANDKSLYGETACASLLIDTNAPASINSIEISPTIQGYYENFTLSVNITDADGYQDIQKVVANMSGGVSFAELTHQGGDIWSAAVQSAFNGTHLVTVNVTDDSGVQSSTTSVPVNTTTNVSAAVRTDRDLYHRYYNNVTSSYDSYDTISLFDNPALANLTFRILVDVNTTGNNLSKADIVWVVDRSNGMAAKQQDISDYAGGFVAELTSKGIDYQLGVVAYLGSTDKNNPYLGTANSYPMTTAGGSGTPFAGTGEFTTDTATFGSMAVAVPQKGSIENGLAALNETLSHYQFRAGSKRYFILVTDEDDDMYGGSVASLGDQYLADIIATLKQSNVTVIVLTKPQHFPEYTGGNGVALQTGGGVFDIHGNFTDVSSGIGSAVGSSSRLRSLPKSGVYLNAQWLNQTNNTVRSWLEADCALTGSEIPCDLYTNSSYNITGYDLLVDLAVDSTNTSYASMVSYKFANASSESGYSLTDASAIAAGMVWLKYPNVTVGFTNNLPMNTSGYLFMSIQRWNGSTWLHNGTVVNETSTRQIPAGGNLSVTSVWNAAGPTTINKPNGPYRAYIALLNSSSGVLIDSNGVAMNATYPFNITTVNVTCSDWNITSPVSWTTGQTACEDVYITGTTVTFQGGYLQAERVFVVSSGTITHTANSASDLYTINISATDLLVESGSTISASSRGYAGATGRCITGSGPGGGTGYGCGSTDYWAGNGAAHGGYGGGGQFNGGGSGSAESDSYGNISAPLRSGSGGGSGNIFSGTDPAGGDGGGRILLNITGVLNVTGSVVANGEAGVAGGIYASGGGGSGGSILIYANTVVGSGSITASGGAGGSASVYGGGGAGGRISINFVNNNYSGTLRANGGDSGGNDGGAGTVYLYDSATQQEELRIYNLYYTAGVTKLNASFGPNQYQHLNLTNATLIGDVLTITNITTISPGTVYLNEFITGTSTVTVYSGATLTHTVNSASDSYTVNITARNINVLSGGAINLNGQGFNGAGGRCTTGNGPGGGTGYGCGATTYVASNGAAHGGYGGAGEGHTTETSVYGDIDTPIQSGSGGGSGNIFSGTDPAGGDGGGRVYLNATETLNVSGTISADATAGQSGATYAGAGGGSGGSIRIVTTSFVGSGSISAIGGAGGSGGIENGGGGGGGRISIFSQNYTYVGTIAIRGGSSSSNSGAAGTLYRCDRTVFADCEGRKENLVLSTGYSQEHSVNITRNLTSDWNTTRVLWNESTSLSSLRVNMSVTGLLPFMQYKLYVNGSFNNTNFSDGSGSVAYFNADASRFHEYLIIQNNSVPTFTMTFNGSDMTQDPVYNAENLLCNVTTNDADDLGLFVYYFIYNGTAAYDNGTVVVNRTFSGQIYNVSGTVTNAYENWTCQFIVGDNAENATQQNVTIQVLSSLPTTNSVNITPAQPYTSDTLLGWCNATDLDLDPVYYYYSWFRNGTLYTSGYADNGGSGYTQGIDANIVNLSSSSTVRGESWILQCRPYDGIANATLHTNSTAVTILNSIPNATSLTLNSSRGLNTTQDDLRAYLVDSGDPDNEPVRKYFDWRLDNRSAAILYMPFDVNNSNATGYTQSYTTGWHAGTVSAVWNTTGGWNESAGYQFTGSSYIDVSTLSSPSGSYTFSFWARSSMASTTARYLFDTQTGRIVIGFMGGTSGLIGYYDGAWHDVADSPNDGQWHHIVFVLDGTQGVGRYYFDGKLNNTATYAAKAIGGSSRLGNLFNGVTQGFVGTMDEVRIYNRTLSLQEIVALYENRTDLWSYADTAIGESWSVCAWVSDELNTTGPTCTQNLTILSGTAPSVSSLIVNTTFGRNSSVENITAYTTIADPENDATHYAIDWRVNGTSIALVNYNFDVNDSAGTGVTKDYSMALKNGTVTGAVWTEGVGWNESGAYRFDGINDRISIPNITLTPSAGSIAFWWKPEETIGAVQHPILRVGLASPTRIFDALAWSDGIFYAGWYNNANDDRAKWTMTGINPGVWYHVTVTWVNGGATILYINGAQVRNTTTLDATFDTTSAGTNIMYDNLNGGYAAGILDEFVIYNRTLSAAEIYAFYINRTNVIDSNETTIGDNWSVCVTPNDGWHEGSTSCSNGLLVSANVVTLNATITPSPAYTLDTLLGWCNGTNGVNSNVSYYWQWYSNNALNLSGYSDNGGVNYTQNVLVNVANISSGNTTKGQNWTFSCLASYAELNGTWFNSSTLVINNSLAAIASFVVNSTLGSNLSSENLTAHFTIVDNDSDPIHYAVDWRVNGTSIALANFNFDVNNSNGTGKVQDYSTNGNNFSVKNAVWNATAGWNGTGAYIFDGSGDELNRTTRLITTNTFSISAWFKIASGAMAVDQEYPIVTQYNGGNGRWTFSVDSRATQGNDSLRFFIGGTGGTTVNSSTKIVDGTWYHAVMTSNNGNVTVYLNGVPNGTGTYTIALENTNTEIGGDSNSAVNSMNGVIDELAIWNRSLSAAEVRAIYQNKTNVIVSNETVLWENWTACVTPNDGVVDGSTTCSGGLQITNGGTPTVQSVSITPQPAYTTDTLLGWCNATTGSGSNVTYEYVWYLNDTVNASGLANNSESNYTQGILVNIVNISSSVTVRGQSWILQCRATNEIGSGSWMNSSTLTINNTIPQVSALIVNSTSGYNVTSDNITAYASFTTDYDNDPVRAIYDWRVNGTSIAVLNMNFDVNNSAGTGVTKDYSTRMTNGSVNGATWNATSGWNSSGSYIFDGNDYISFGSSTQYNGTTEFTISAWFKQSSFSTYDGIIVSHDGSSQGFGLDLRDDDNVGGFVYGTGGTSSVSSAANSISSDVWYHAVIVWRGSDGNIDLYINGVLNASNGTVAGTGTLRQNTVARIGDDSGAGGRGFNGVIDDVRVFNRSLSSAQILALYNNRTDLIVAQETQLADNWTACVTPNDGANDGSTSCASLTIINALPSITSLILNASSIFNTTDDNLTAYTSTSDPDGQNVHLTYDWRVNGTSITLLNLDFEPSGTQNATDRSTYARNGTTEGSVPYVTMGYNGSYAYDFQGSGSGDGVNMGTWNVTQAFSVEAWINADSFQNDYNGIVTKWDNGNNKRSWGLYAAYTAGRPAACISSTGSNYYCARDTSMSYSAGEWYHVVMTYDGTGSSGLRMYVNGTERTLTADATSGTVSGQLFQTDTDVYVGRSLLVSGGAYYFNGRIDNVRVYDRVLSQDQIVALYQNRTNFIVLNETQTGESWSVCATPNDGTADGSANCSSSLLITPGLQVNLANITPQPAYTTDVLLGWCNGTSTYSTNITYHWQWFRNGTLNLSGYATNGGTNYTQGLLANVANITAANTTRSETWIFSCLASDAGLNSTWVNSTGVTISNSPPVATLIVNSTLGTNLTSEDLTAHVTLIENDSEVARRIVDWRRNGSSIAVANFNFDLNGTEQNYALDYSSYGNNGTLGTNKPTWNATGGYNGSGAYDFDGSNDVMYMNHTDSLNITGNLTIAVWIYPYDETAQDDRVVAKHHTSDGSPWLVWGIFRNGGTSNYRFLVSTGGGNSVQSQAPSVPLNTWTHIVGRYNGTHTSIFINGTQVDADVQTGAIDSNTKRVDIAHNSYGREFYNGLIDDLLIVNASLSDAQILALYQNQSHVIDDAITEIGDNWTACVTPNDGLVDGATTCSSGLQIVQPSTQVLTTCQNITSPGSYELGANLSADGTCITIRSDYVTLDCKNYLISYANTETGYAINASNTSLDNVTIKNCQINQSSAQTYSYGIYMGGTNHTIQNNTFARLGQNAYAIYGTTLSNSLIIENLAQTEATCGLSTCGHNGVYLSSSNGNNITHNRLLTVYGNSEPIELSSSNSNSITYNVLESGVSGSAGISLAYSDNNTFLYNNITTYGEGGYGVYIDTSANANNFSYNIINATTDIGIYLGDSGNAFADNIIVAEEQVVYFSATNTTLLRNNITAGEYPSFHFQSINSPTYVNHTIEGNLENGRAIQYYKNHTGLTLGNLTDQGPIIIALSQNVVLQNVSIKNASLQVYYSSITLDAINISDIRTQERAFVAGYAHVNLSSSRILSYPDAAALTSSNVTITNSTINATGTSASDGVDITGGSVNISSSILRGRGFYSIIASSTVTLNVTHSTIYAQDSSMRGIYLNGPDNAYIENNRFLIGSTSSYGINAQSTALGNKFFNNNFTSTATSGNVIYIDDSSSNEIRGNTINATATEAININDNTDDTQITGNAILAFQEAILIDTTADRTNVSGNNLTTVGASQSTIYLLSTATNTTIEHNNISSRGASGHAIYLNVDNGTTINNNTVHAQNTTTVSALFSAGAGRSVITNNNFTTASGLAPVNLTGTIYNNTWNQTQSSATNIIGGPYLGGNYYANGAGTGFSQSCSDGNGDGFCDSSYTLDTDNVDYLPLRIPSSCAPPGSGDWTVYASDNCVKTDEWIVLSGGGKLIISGASGAGSLTLRNANVTASDIEILGLGSLSRIVLESGAQLIRPTS